MRFALAGGLRGGCVCNRFASAAVLGRQLCHRYCGRRSHGVVAGCHEPIYPGRRVPLCELLFVCRRCPYGSHHAHAAYRPNDHGGFVRHRVRGASQVLLKAGAFQRLRAFCRDKQAELGVLQRDRPHLCRVWPCLWAVLCLSVQQRWLGTHRGIALCAAWVCCHRHHRLGRPRGWYHRHPAYHFVRDRSLLHCHAFCTS